MTPPCPDLEWVINAYALVFAALMLSSGSLVDRFGSKKTFITGVTIFIFASVCCVLSPTIYWLDLMRESGHWRSVTAAKLFNAASAIFRRCP